MLRELKQRLHWSGSGSNKLTYQWKLRSFPRSLRPAVELSIVVFPRGIFEHSRTRGFFLWFFIVHVVPSPHFTAGVHCILQYICQC